MAPRPRSEPAELSTLGVAAAAAARVGGARRARGELAHGPSPRVGGRRRGHRQREVRGPVDEVWEGWRCGMGGWVDGWKRGENDLSLSTDSYPYDT